MRRSLTFKVMFLILAAALGLAYDVHAQNCAAVFTPNLPNPGQLIPNFGNFVNVTVHTSSTCDQASIKYQPFPNGGIIVDQSTLTTTKQSDGSYPDLVFTFRAGSSSVPGRYSFGVVATGASFASSYQLTLDVVGNQAPGFSYTVTPGMNPNTITIPAGTTQTFNVTTAPDNGFNSPITYAVSTSAGYPVDKPTQTINSPYPPISFAVGVPATAQPGSSFSIDINASGGGTSVPHTIMVTVGAPVVQPDFSVAVTPNTVSVTPGLAGVPVTFSVTGSNGFNGAVTFFAPAPANIVFSDNGVPVTSFDVTAGQSKTILVSAAAAAQQTTTTATFAARSGTLPQKQAVLTINVLAPPPAGDFNIAVQPTAVTVKSGTQATATLTVNRINGFAGEVTLDAISSSPDVQVQFVPSNIVGSGENSRTVVVTAAPNITTASTALITLTAAAPTLNNKRLSVAVPVTIQPVVVPPVNAPVLSSIAPDGAVAGGAPTAVMLVGANFAGSVQAVSSNPGIVVVSTAVVAPGTMARAFIRVKPGTKPGRYRIDLQNDPPNGARTTAGVDFFVYDSSDIGAPLGVTGAAILSPLSGKCLFAGSEIYAHGVVATSGTGTITGHWEVEDGGAFASFSTFTLTVQAGEPTPVDTKVPIPASYAGTHRLRLVIDSPQVAQSAEVPLLMSAVPCATDLTILGPLASEQATAAGATSLDASVDESDGTAPVTLRWSLVPGALGYVVEIERDGQFFKRAGACSEDELRGGIPCERYDTDRGELDLDLVSLTTRETPDDNDVVTASALADLQQRKFRWRVTPKYPGEFEGLKWSDWAPLPIPQAMARSGRSERVVITRAALDAALPLNARAVLSASEELSDAPEADLRQIAYEASSAVGEPAMPTAPGPVAKKNPFRRDWLAIPSMISTYTHGADQQEGTLQISSQADFGMAPLALKYSTDFNGTNLYGNGFSARNSRNWVANFGNAAKSTMLIRPEAVVGYTPPSFFSEAQFMTASFNRGGALARAATKYGTLSYYTTFDSLLSGIIPGGFSREQKVDAAAFELPKTKRFSMKLLTMRVRDLASTDSEGSVGRSFGLFTRFRVSSALELTGEAAHGKFASNDDSGQNRDGNAFRVAASGVRGKLTYRASVSHTDAGFVNPANRGFTYGGIPNRTGGDLSIVRMVAGGTVSAQVRRQQQSKPTSHSSANGVNLSYSHRIGTRSMLTLSGNRNDDRGTADRKTFLPETHRSQSGLSLSMNESAGRFTFSQSLSRQQLRDRIRPNSDNTNTSLSLTGGGSLFQNFNLSANLAATSSSGSPQIGKSDSFMVAVQPSYAIPSWHISLQPRLSYNQSRNNRYHSDTSGQQYQAMVDWSPEWLHSLAALQLSSNWNRSRMFSGFGSTIRSTQRSYTGTFTMRWGAGIGAATFRRSLPLPGQVAATGVANAAKDPVNGHSAAASAAK